MLGPVCSQDLQASSLFSNLRYSAADSAKLLPSALRLLEMQVHLYCYSRITIIYIESYVSSKLYMCCSSVFFKDIPWMGGSMRKTGQSSWAKKSVNALTERSMADRPSVRMAALVLTVPRRLLWGCDPVPLKLTCQSASAFRVAAVCHVHMDQPHICVKKCCNINRLRLPWVSECFYRITLLITMKQVESKHQHEKLEMHSLATYRY